MKKIVLALLLLAAPAFAGPLEPWQGGTGCETDSTYLVSQLPGSPNKGTICTISDGADETDCTVGGGTSENVCIYISGGSGVDYGWKQLDLDYTEVSDSFYVTKNTNGGLPEPSVIPSCKNGTDGGVLGYNTSTHAFVCYDTTRLAIVATTSDPTNGLCYFSNDYNTIQCGNGVGITTMFSTAPIPGAFTLAFEGDVDDENETRIDVVEPTNDDNTILLPNASGTFAISASSPITLSAAGDIGLTAFSGDVSSSGSTLTIGADKVVESMLKAVDAPGDEECFTYESTVGDFEWQTCTPSSGSGAFLLLDGSNDPVTGAVIFIAAGTSVLSGVQDSSGSATAVGVLASNNVDAANVDALLVQGPNRATAANGDNVNVVFQLEDSAGGFVQMASIRATANDVTTTAMDGGLLFFGITGGTEIEMMRAVATTAGQATIVINEGGNDIDFRVETDNEGNMIFCNGAADSCTFGTATEIAFVGVDGTADQIQFAVQGVAGQTADLVVFENSSGTDQLTISGGGLITDYGAEATVARGVPAIVAEVALTGQTTDITATTLYTAPAADTTVRVSAYTIVTRAATTSSTLGSLGIAYTDADNTTSQNMTLRCNNRTGTSTTSVTGNSLTTSLNCEAVVRMNASSSMTYEQGYASSGATTMQYSTYWTVERLQ